MKNNLAKLSFSKMKIFIIFGAFLIGSFIGSAVYIKKNMNNQENKTVYEKYNGRN